LVELLVSIAVVTILMAAMISLLNSTTFISGESSKHLDEDNEARAVFDRMAGDFGRIVNRTDVDYIFRKAPGNETCFFYSEAPALQNTSSVSYAASLQSTVALIGYKINSSYQLERLGIDMVLGASPPNGMVFLTYPQAASPPQPGTAADAPNSLSTFANPVWQPLVGTPNDTPPYSTGTDGTSSDYHILGPNVFRLEYCFLLKPYVTSTGTVLPAAYSDVPYDTRASPGPNFASQYGLGLNNVQAIVVVIAILDAKTRKIISTANLGTLAGSLSDSNFSIATPVTPSVILMAQNWESEMAVTNFSGVLKVAAQNVRIYQRTFYLSSFLNTQ
jgi:hypothetical protein